MADDDDDDLADCSKCKAYVPMDASVCIGFGLFRQGDIRSCTARQEGTIGADTANTEC